MSENPTNSSDGEQNPKPAFIGPQTDVVDCYICGERIPAADAEGIDLSKPGEYYPEMRPVCPSCGDSDE